MAKQSIESLRDKALADKTALEKELVKLQEAFRKDPANAGARDRLNAHKRQVAAKAAEYGELARAASIVAGGKNYTPPAG